MLSGDCTHVQALADADAVDARAAAGENTSPLCGLPLAVKDSIDVKGLPTSGGTPALLGASPSQTSQLQSHDRAAVRPDLGAAPKRAYHLAVGVEKD